MTIDFKGRLRRKSPKRLFGRTLPTAALFGAGGVLFTLLIAFSPYSADAYEGGAERLIPVEEEGLAAEETFESPHIFGAIASCALCHTYNPPELIDEPVEVCLRCHPGNGSDHPVYNHPIDVEVTFLTPSPLPLINQRLVCSTCHDPHASSEIEGLLRVEYQMLCIQCHVDY